MEYLETPGRADLVISGLRADVVILIGLLYGARTRRTEKAVFASVLKVASSPRDYFFFFGAML